MQIAMIGQKGIGTGYVAKGKVTSVGGGVETHVLELSTRLVRLGHAVVAYSRAWYVPRGTARVNSIDIVRLPSIHTKRLDTITHTLFATLHAVIIVRPDVYHFHGVGPALLSWIPRVLAPRATVITTFHSVDQFHEKWGAFARFMLRLGERAAFLFADETLASSKSIVSYAEREYGLRATYIPNGITPVRTSVDPLLLSPFGLQPFGYVVMVSRLVPHKSAHTLITAWQRARTLRPDLFDRMKLAIVGGGAFTDDYVRKLHMMTSHDDSVVFAGHQRGETLDALFAGACFMVHPSTKEGHPIAVLEGMSYGKAVIAADIPETMEVVQEYGVPFLAENIEELTDAMIDLATDPMHAAAIGHAARIFVEDEFHWDDIAQDVLTVYRRHTMIREGVFAVR